MTDQPGDPVRALTFGAVAEAYERHRLGYPGEVVDELLAYAGRPVRTAVEVGAGTGKATRLVASRGIAVTALEPDADMARVLARTTRDLPVTTVLSTFEQFSTDRTVDLVYAAAAWHWTDPATRWERAAQLLVPGGVLALFGTPAEPADPALRAAVDEVEARFLFAEDVHRWSIRDAGQAGTLVDTERRQLPGTTPTTPDDFIGRLSTVSAYLLLDPGVRAEALSQVHAVLPDRFELNTTVQLSLARRA